jgi:hypothetical protein
MIKQQMKGKLKVIYKLTRRFGMGHDHSLEKAYFIDIKNAKKASEDFAKSWSTLTGVKVVEKSSGTWEEDNGWVLSRIEKIETEDGD